MVKASDVRVGDTLYAVNGGDHWYKGAWRAPRLMEAVVTKITPAFVFVKGDAGIGRSGRLQRRWTTEGNGAEVRGVYASPVRAWVGFREAHEAVAAKARAAAVLADQDVAAATAAIEAALNPTCVLDPTHPTHIGPCAAYQDQQAITDGDADRRASYADRQGDDRIGAKRWLDQPTQEGK